MESVDRIFLANKSNHPAREGLTIIYADDNELDRLGASYLLRTLASKVEVIEATNFQALFDLSVSSNKAQLIVFDLALPGFNRKHAIRDLRNVFPDIPIVVFSCVEDLDVITESLRDGASGFVLKSSSAEVIAKAFGLILCGEVYFPKTIVSLINFAPMALHPKRNIMSLPSGSSRGLSSRTKSFTARDMVFGGKENLTRRQSEVLLLLTAGLTNKEIAKKLDISPGTVKNYVADVLHILGIANRGKAICKILSQGDC